MNRKDINFNPHSEAFRAFRDDYYNEVNDMSDVTPWVVERYSRIIEGRGELILADDFEFFEINPLQNAENIIRKTIMNHFA